jgi:gliding motility-associated-like protein
MMPMKIFTTKGAFLVLLFLFLSLPGFAQVANFTASKISGCTPFEVKFKSTSTGTITSYYWDLGDGRTDTKPEVSLTYTTAGTYTITLTVTGSSGTKSSKSMTLNVYPSPTVNFSASPLSICPCELVSFTNSSIANSPGPISSIWSFGDGNTATTDNTSYRYCTPGTYDVALKVTNSAGCVAAKLDKAKIKVNESPEAVFIASKVNLCKVPDTTDFSSYVSKGTPPYTYSWDFGDGLGSSTAANPTYAYKSLGSFTVRLIVTDANGCKDTTERIKYIVSQAMNSNFKLPVSSCPGLGLKAFENTSTPLPLNVKWSFSDGQTATGLIAERHFWKGNTFTVTMIDSFGPGCKDTAIKSYTIYPRPHPIFSYSPIYPCPAPATISFTNKSYATDSFFWIFGDGTTSTAASPSHTYMRDSVYTVFLIGKTSYGCLDTFRLRDTMQDFPGGYPNPAATDKKRFYDSTNSPVIVRIHKGEVNIYADSTGGCLPFVLKPIAKMCGSSKLPADTSLKDCAFPKTPLGYPSPLYWKCLYPYHATDKYPDDVVDPYILPTTTSCTEDPHPYPIVSYSWDFGDGTYSTLANPTHTYFTEGQWMVKVTVQTANGCSHTDSLYVTAGNTPLADFTVSTQDLCIHDTVVFTNKSKLGRSFIWDFKDGTFYTTNDSLVVYKKRFDHTDTFKVVLTATRNGCKDTMVVPIVVRPPQVFDSIQYYCTGNDRMKVFFGDKSKGATSVLWRFGDGATSTSPAVTHTYALPGKYTASHVVYNNIYNCSDSISYEIYIFDPKPFFSTADTTICVGDTITYIDAYRDYFVNWSWYTDAFSQEDKGRRFHMGSGYPDTGRYDVLYVAQDIHGCLDTFFRPKYVLVAKPQMKMVASPLVGCTPATINFTDMSTNVKGANNINRTWNWGDATSSTGPGSTASHFYPTTGGYKVKLIVKDDIGCKDSVEVDVQVRKPKANFVAEVNDTTCMDRNVKFHSISSGVALTYTWNFGDGGTGSGADPVYAYKSIGTFDVRLIITDDMGCKDTIIKPAFITTVKPTASFTMSDSIALCPPLFVNFTNASSANSVRFLWDFDNGSTAGVRNPVAPFLDARLYVVKLIAFDKFGCTDTAYGRARVAGYDGAFKYTPLSGCAPHMVEFQADLIKADVMVWDFADGTTESAEGKSTITHIYTTPGAYVPRLILGDGEGCSTSSMGLDTIKVDAVEAVISSSPKCIGTLIVFDDASKSFFSSHSSSEWTFDDGTTSTDKNPRRTYTKTGTYSVQLITTNGNGCKDTINTSFTVNPLPVIKAHDTVICLGDPAILSAGGGVSYKWDASSTLSCTDCNNPTTKTTVPAIYYVTGTDANGCKSRDTLSVGIKTKTTMILADKAEVCEDIPVQLVASGAHGYTWTPDSFLNNAYIPDPIATMKHTVVYRVIGVEGSCIPDTGYIEVTVHPTPEVNAGADQKVLAGTEVQLSGSGKYIKDYLWTPDTLVTCGDCQNAIARPMVTTTFTLRGTSEYGCSDSDDVIITIFCDKSQLFIPNTFTPNGDGQNDFFYPQGQGISKITSFVIYNRWGQKVYERTGINANSREQGWDGSFNGDMLSPDTFVYTLEATCDNGESVFWKGDITLIK